MPTSGDDDYDDSDAESSCYHFLNTPSPCSGCGKVIAKIEEDVESSGAEESSDDILSEVYVREADFIYYQHGTTTETINDALATQTATGNDDEVHDYWKKLVVALNELSNRKHLLVARNAALTAYVDDGLPPTELSIAFVGELSSRRKKQHFSKKSTLRIIASMRRVSKYQMGREGMCGFLADDKIVQFFSWLFYKDVGAITSTRCMRLEDGMKYLTGLITSSNFDILFPQCYKDVRSMGRNLKFLGYGAHCAAYSGELDSCAVVFKLYNSCYDLVHERYLLNMLNETPLAGDIPVALENDLERALIITPLCESFAYSAADFEERKPVMKSCHYIYLVKLLQKAHAANVLHLDVAPWNFFVHPQDPDKVLLNDWGTSVSLSQLQAQFTGNVLLAPERVLMHEQIRDPRARMKLLPADDLEMLVNCMFMVHTRRCEEVMQLPKKNPRGVAAFWRSNLVGWWKEAITCARNVDYDGLMTAIQANI